MGKLWEERENEAELDWHDSIKDGENKFEL